MANGITKITVHGFKSLYDETSIEIRPLTILAGANSSGKSSIMQPLLLMKQTLEASYNPAGPFVLDGANVRFTSTEQFLHKSGSTTYQNMTVKMAHGYETLSINYKRHAKKKKLEIHEQVYQNTQITVKLTPSMSHEDILNQLSERDKERLGKLTRRPILSVQLEKCFLSVNPLSFTILDMMRHFEMSLITLLHVPGLRRYPERTYKNASAEENLFPGTFDIYVAGIISNWQLSESIKTRHKIFELGRYLSSLGLTSKIAAKRLDETQLELKVAHSRLNPQMVSIADVGLGVSQVLPVLVALLVAAPGRIVYIEQPELHLHPRAQVALAEILAEAANRGVRVVIETHSSLLIQGIQTLIAQKKLDHEKVMLHWFTRDEEGKTHVDSQEPDEFGATGDFPEDFSEVELDTQSRYMEAVEQRELEQFNADQKPEMPGD